MSHPAQLHPLVPLPEEVLALLLRCGGEEQVLRPDELIAAFTRAQAGSVARPQLLAAGLPRNSVDNRLQRRQLIARFRGVYAPGHLNLGIHGHRTAAVLAVSGSLLSHGSATALHGVGGAPGRWHVTVPGAGRRDPNYEIVVHTSTTLRHDEICVVQGLPCTTLTRSIVDAASHLSARQLANVLARAERASSLHLASLRHTLERTRTAPTRGHCTLLSARP